MKYIKFEISKFKGIDHEIIDLSKIPQGKIFPLVGLNESGKTTILEAINFFQEEIDDDKKNSYIHKHDLISFSGEISCTATLELESDDKKIIEDFLTEQELKIRDIPETITITKLYTYNNSHYENKNIKCGIDINVKKSNERNFNLLHNKNETLENQLIEKLIPRIPKILYFSNFLFNFPERIRLENIDSLILSDEEKENHRQYQKVLNDILMSINNNLNINDFLGKIKGDSQGRDAGNAILQAISSKLKEKIIEPWGQIFPGNMKGINVKVDNDAYGYYVNLGINIGSSRFSVSEMSLGFRRFFSFILFTEFRKARNDEPGEYLFLFDEPASNLHEHSQQKLLDIFDKLVGNNKAKIIYSTHSPYLINPEYILNTFVIKDEGRNNDNEFEYRQNIKAYPYKQFVGNLTNEKSHFKPILDALDFVTNPFELSNNIIFTEGQNDYYTFKRIKDSFFQELNFNFYPGGGVTSYDRVFREYLANNKNFIAIFDADTAGNNAKKRYLDNISLELKDYIFTLEDVEATFKDRTTEFLFSDEDKIKIQKITYEEDTEYDKDRFNKSIQNILINKISCTLSEESLNNFKAIFDFIKLKINATN